MAEQLLELENSNGDITIRLDGDEVRIRAGIKGHKGSIVITSPDHEDEPRIRIDAGGGVHAGGSRASGIVAGFHAEAPHGDVESGATALLNAEDGSLHLSRFDSGAGRTLTIELNGQQASARIGGPGSAGTLQIRNENDRTMVQLEGSDGEIRAGGVGANGSLTLLNSSARPRVEVEGEHARIRLRQAPLVDGPTEAGGPPSGPVTIEIAGDEARISAGVSGHAGVIGVQDEAGRTVLNFDGAQAEVKVGTRDRSGRVTVKNREGTNKITLNGQSGRVTGETGRFRDVFAIDGAGRNQIQLDGNDATIRCGRQDQPGRIDIRSTSGENIIVLNGSTGNCALGSEGNAGALFIKDATGENRIVLNGGTANAGLGGAGNAGALFVKDGDGADSIVLNGAAANVGIGSSGTPGNIFVKNSAGQDTIVVNGSNGNIGVGDNGQAGDIFVRNSDGDDVIHLKGSNGNVGIGGHGEDGDVFVKDAEGRNTIHLSGNSGDIILINADCAEEFDATDPELLGPGTVTVIDERGRLRSSERAYDTRVAGVVSGAGDYRPGILLDRQGAPESRVPVALVGKVFCKVDAKYGPIRVGDLLTTSDTAGRAMRASDPALSHGAVIGKALRPCEEGHHLIPILVALQ